MCLALSVYTVLLYAGALDDTRFVLLLSCIDVHMMAIRYSLVFIREGRGPGALSSTASGALSPIHIAQQIRPMAAAGPWGHLRPPHVHTRTHKASADGGACACGGAGTHTRTGFRCAGAHWAWPHQHPRSRHQHREELARARGHCTGPCHVIHVCVILFFL